MLHPEKHQGTYNGGACVCVYGQGEGSNCGNLGTQLSVMLLAVELSQGHQPLCAMCTVHISSPQSLHITESVHTPALA